MTKLNLSIDLTEHARCLDCGYSLRGLPENRCPECGRIFDRTDWSTMRVADHSAIRPLKDADRRILAPQLSTGKWLPPALIIFVLVLTQYPGYIWPPLFCWSVLCGFSLLGRELRGHQRRRVIRECGLDRAVLKVHNAVDHRLRGWALAAFVLILLRAPFLLNIAISGTFLDRLADQLYTQHPLNEPQSPRMAGLLFVHGIHVEPRHVDFLMTWPVIESKSHSDEHPADWNAIIWYQAVFQPDNSIVLRRHLPDYYHLPELSLWLFPRLN